MTQEKEIEKIIDEIFDNAEWRFSFNRLNRVEYFFMYYKKIKVVEYYPGGDTLGLFVPDFFDFAYSMYILTAVGFDVRKIDYHQDKIMHDCIETTMKKRAHALDPECQTYGIVNGYLFSEINF